MRIRNCQLKKLVRIKTRQPMVLTDTVFDKVLMDIMEQRTTGPDNRKWTLVYIHDTRFVYQIFSGGTA